CRPYRACVAIGPSGRSDAPVSALTLRRWPSQTRRISLLLAPTFRLPPAPACKGQPPASLPFGLRALSLLADWRGQRMAEDKEQQPESLLPYDEWVEEAMRQVVARAVTHVAANGLPGEHHFYVTFRTDYPGVVMPPRLRTRYPQEMTIVLQHQF